MSFHILHLLSPNLRVRLKLDQLQVTDTRVGTDRTVPLEDVAVIVCATPDMTVTAGVLRRMSELNVLLLVCNEKFEPCCLTLPYYNATDTALLRSQLEWSKSWKELMWRQVVAAKVRNQAAVIKDDEKASGLLREIAGRCDGGGKQSLVSVDVPPTILAVKVPLSQITASRRAEFLSTSPWACESRAAKHYWKKLMPVLGAAQMTGERKRMPGERAGVNGFLDYGYAIMRTAVLRSLAAHGFIAALGISHSPKAGSYALADDLMEPLRPFVDLRLRKFLADGPRTMQEWTRDVVAVLTEELTLKKSRVRLLNAIDLLVESFADAARMQKNIPLRIPLIE